MSRLVPNWRCFQTVSSDAEAASFAESCRFSLATLEVDCDSDTNCFALTERERPGAWRWAIISARGVVLESGCEVTQVAAKRMATEALHRSSPMTPRKAEAAVPPA
jgi:hypothetical protein